MSSPGSTSSPAPLQTPVRELGHRDPGGYLVLRDVGSTYRDGAEEVLLELVADAADPSSDSDELIRHAKTWAQRYHLDPARANVIRALDLPANARVLEIGAGCGAITRYVGEQCAVVDALEPVPARAAVAAQRCSDLPGVQVLVGELDDVPEAPTYDLVLVIGVLEYVGGGTHDLEPYRRFLDDIAARLVDGGSLVLAIENKLGVKYLAGAPEDHSARVYDSVEGYPRAAPAHTFSRRELETLIGDSGLSPHTRVAFPDYKMTRAVFGEMPDHYRSLLHRIPVFPSPDWTKPRPRIGSEAAIWRQLVNAGLDRDFGNSLVVVAGKGAAPSRWPDERLAVYFSSGRRREFEVRTEVVESDGELRFRRTRRSTTDSGTAGGLRVLESTSPYEPGTDLLDLVAAQGLAVFGRYAEAWLQLLDTALAEDASSAVDALPHNVVVTDDGGLRVIDIEFSGVSMTRDQLIRRGIFVFTERLTQIAPPERFAPAAANRDVMIELGQLVGLDPEGTWIQAAIANEVDFICQLRPVPFGVDTETQWRRTIERQLNSVVDRELVATALGEHVWDQHAAAVARGEQQQTRIEALQAEVTALRSDVKRSRSAAEDARRAAQRQSKTVQRLPEVRAGRKIRRVADRALPPGTTRRRAVAKAVRRTLR